MDELASRIAEPELVENSPTPTNKSQIQGPIHIDAPSGVLTAPPSFAKAWKCLQFFGPAAILTSLSLGAGETIMVAGLGAWANYQLLWLLLLSVLVKGVVVTYLIGRYTAITGQSISHRLAQLPGPRGWFLFCLVAAELGVLSMGLTTVAKPCGNLLANLQGSELQFGLPFSTWENIWTTILLLLAMFVGQVSTFQSLEKQQIYICGFLVAGTTLAVVLVKPDLWQLVLGAIQFGHLPDAPDWAPAAARKDYALNLVTVFSYVGGGLSGYLAYSNWIALRGWGINSHPRIDELRSIANTQMQLDYLPVEPVHVNRLRVLRSPLYWDVGLGALVLFCVTAAFLASGAAVLYPMQLAIGGNEWELLTKQATIWRQIHDSLVPIYYVAVILALWGTLAAVPDAITRVAHEYLSSVWFCSKWFSMEKLRLLVVSWLFVTTVGWTWSGVSFALLTQVGSFITLNVALSLVLVLAIYFNVTLPRPYRPSRLLFWSGVGSSLILFCCTYGAGIGLVRKFME